MSIDGVIERVAGYPAKLIEITGGEPLEQEDVYPLMQELLDREYIVMLETGGHISVERVPEPVVKVIDIKCPDSGEAEKNYWENIRLAAPHDEFKFVIATRRDYEWARQVYREKLAGQPNTSLFSASHDDLPHRELSGWILEDGLPVRMQLQMHKYIWGATARGV